MKSGKRVLGVIIVSLLLIVSISLVSAGIKDWIGFGSNNKDLEGELASNAPAAVALQNTLSPPVIVFVSDVIDSSGSSVNIVTPNSRGINSGNINVYFYFIAQQGNDDGNLDKTPGNTGFAQTILNNSFVGDLTRTNMSCNTVGLIYWPIGQTSTQGVNYSCTVVMRYYDRPVTWIINATVRDPTTGLKATNSSKIFSVVTNNAGSSSATYLNWTSPALTSSDKFRDSDNTPNITNDGNGVFGAAALNATWLNGTIPSLIQEGIGPANFSVGSNQATLGISCGAGTTLITNTNTAIGINVPRAIDETLSQTKFYVCLKGPLSGLSTQTYKSLGGPWQIN